MSKKLSLTIGIATCFADESLVRTLKSVLISLRSYKAEIIVVADRTPIKKVIANQLKFMGVKLIWNPKEGSQYKKRKQIIDLCITDYLILTQDDVIFERNTISEIVKMFESDSKITMVTVPVLPLKPLSLFESIVGSAVRIHNFIAVNWNGGGNYFASSGRCLSFTTTAIKKFRIPEQIINGDTFLYFENKRLKGTQRHASKAKVLIRCPQTLKDQIRPSNRFQYSKTEMKKYFEYSLDSEYTIPIKVLVKALIQGFLESPRNTILYTIIFLYMRVIKQSRDKVTNPIWDIDISTKKVAI